TWLRPPRDDRGPGCRWNERRQAERSRGAPRLGPPRDDSGLGCRWNERRQAERSRGAPRLGPPRDDSGLAALDTVTATTIAIPADRSVAQRQWLTFLGRLARRRTALFGLVVVALVLVAALGAP